MSAERPLLPAPHRIIAAFAIRFSATRRPRRAAWSFHSMVTLSATLLGFLLGALLGIALALMIVHSRVLEKSLLPWIICSQMCRSWRWRRSSSWCSARWGCRACCQSRSFQPICVFFPIHDRNGERVSPAPDPIQLDLMRTWSATPRQVLSKLRWPSTVPYLFASLKVAVAISLIGSHRGRTADRRRSRHWRAAAGGLLLWPDHPDLVGAAGRRRSSHQA